MDYSYNSPFHQELHSSISELINGDIDAINESDFNHLALQLFTYQFFNNNLYQKLCKRGFGIGSPKDIDHYTDIPAVPVDIFKKYLCVSFPEELLPQATEFSTTGTTMGIKGKIWRDPKTMELHDSAYIKANKEYYFLGLKRAPIHFMTSPPYTVLDSAIGRVNQIALEHFGTDDSFFYVDRGGFHKKKLADRLKQYERNETPVALKCATFLLVRFLDYCNRLGISFDLPEGSRSADGGGFRGLSRELPKDELIKETSELFGTPESHVINVYGCSERPSVIFDNVLRNNLLGIDRPRYKPNYPWTKILIVDPDQYPKETDYLKEGERGLIKYYDLTDMGTVVAVQFNDIGELKCDGFEIYGKAKGGENENYLLGVKYLEKTIGVSF